MIFYDNNTLRVNKLTLSKKKYVIYSGSLFQDFFFPFVLSQCQNTVLEKLAFAIALVAHHS